MNIKKNIHQLICLLDERAPIQQVAPKLSSMAATCGLFLPIPMTGSGYFQWSLQGDGWKSFSELTDAEKASVASVFAERCGKVRTMLKGSLFEDVALKVPSEDCIYIRESGDTLEIALVAWGYRSSSQPSSESLETWISQTPVQSVAIGFSWNGDLLRRMPFYLNGYDRQTDDEGLLRLEKPVEVGQSYTLKTYSGDEFTLTVEAGKNEYFFDITRYFRLALSVSKDSVPVPSATVDVSFGSFAEIVQCGQDGKAELIIPLIPGLSGSVQSQPECQAKYENIVKNAVPTSADETIQIDIDVKTIPNQPDKPYVVIPNPADDPLDGDFTISLFDYAGYPLPDMPFKLITRKSGVFSLKTDDNGICKISKKSIKSGDKIRVTFTVTGQYQKLHDIHLKKS